MRTRIDRGPKMVVGGIEEEKASEGEIVQGCRGLREMRITERRRKDLDREDSKRRRPSFPLERRAGCRLYACIFICMYLFR